MEHMMCVMLLFMAIGTSQSLSANSSRYVGFATNASLNASVFLRIALMPWSDAPSADNGMLALVANMSIYLNPGSLRTEATSTERHITWDVAELNEQNNVVTFPSVFDPASELEQFLLPFKFLLGNTSSFFGRLQPDGSMVLTLGDAFPAISMAADTPVPQDAPALLRANIGGLYLMISMRGPINRFVEVLLSNDAASPNVMFSTAALSAAEVGCAVFPVTMNRSSHELLIGQSPERSCVTAALQRIIDPHAVARLLFAAGAKLVLFPQGGTRLVATEVEIVSNPTPLASSTSYCGNYGGTPFVKLRIHESQQTNSSSSSGTEMLRLRIGCDISSSGFTQRVEDVNFVLDPSTSVLSLPNRSEPASVAFLSAVGSVGRSPWIEIERDDMSDSFWVTVSIGAFALTRC